MNYFFHLMILILDGWLWTFMSLSRMNYMNLSNKKFKVSAKINLDEVTMTYVGLSATSKRSTTPVSSGV